MRDFSKDTRLLEYVRSIIGEMLEVMAAARLDKPGSEKAVLRKINSIIDQFGLDLAEVIPPQIVQDYFGGVDEASAQLRAAGESVPPGLALTKEGLIAQPFQSVIHLAAVEELLDDTMLDLGAALNTTKASARDAVNAVRGDITKGLIRGDTRKQITSVVMSTFLDRGITSFVTSDGRQLPLDFYAMTVVRTKTRTATVQGSANRFLERGHDLIQIRGNGDSCAKCARFNGMVLSTTGDTPGYPVVGQGMMQLPPFHPNCRCSVSVFIPKFKTQEELDEAQRKNAAFDPDVDPRTPEQKAFYDEEQRLRRKANAEKKQFMRWQSELGAEAPKTLAAFRRMKRQNTVQFQQLQSEFRSARMTGVVRAPRAAPIAAAAPVAPAAAVAGPTISPAVTTNPPTPFNERNYFRAQADEMKAAGERNYDAMTTDERGAYSDYVGTGNSFSLNRFLYSGRYDKALAGEEDLDGTRAEIMFDQINAFSTLVSKHRIDQQMRAYRMVDGDFMDSVLAKVGLANKVYFEPHRKSTHEPYLKTARLGLQGVRFKNKSFMSTSYDPGQNVFTERPIRLELLVDKGQKGLITRNHFESEVVFDKDTELEFLDFEVLEGDDGTPFFNILTRIVK